MAAKVKAPKLVESEYSVAFLIRVQHPEGRPPEGEDVAELVSRTWDVGKEATGSTAIVDSYQFDAERV